MLQKKITGGVFICDEEDANKVGEFTWYIETQGYVVTNIPKDKNGGKRGRLKMHHLLLGKKEGFELDHINGKKFDNRKQNLRYVVRSENRMNIPKFKSTSNPYKGVYAETRGKNIRWYAVIHKNKKRINIGRFDCPKEAAKAYNAYAKDLHKQYARVNKVEKS